MRKRVWVPLVLIALLVITFFVGPVPDEPVYSNQLPQLPSSLTQLQRYIEQSEDSMPTREDNQARIVWYDSVPTVTDFSVIYLHGFAGSYQDGYPLNVSVADSLGASLYLSL